MVGSSKKSASQASGSGKWSRTSERSTVGSQPPPHVTTFNGPESEIEIEHVLSNMEKGHKVCRISVGWQWEPNYRRICFQRETRQLLVTKMGESKTTKKPLAIDIRLLREVHTLEYRIGVMKVLDKWRRDKDLANLDAAKILILHHGSSFILTHLIFLFESNDAVRMWQVGLRWLIQDQLGTPHPLRIERWLRKEFYAIAAPGPLMVTLKQMKPFVHNRLQYKTTSKALQELVDEQMGFEQFALAYRKLVFIHSLISSRFSGYTEDGEKIPFNKFLHFLNTDQGDEGEAESGFEEAVSGFLARYVGALEAGRETARPTLHVAEFLDLLFARENTLYVGDEDAAEDMSRPLSHYWINSSHNTYLTGDQLKSDSSLEAYARALSMDMSRPLSHYWINSSHNTYLTGDQLKSDSSLEAYARALSMGCRCIELDCWDGTKKEKPVGKTSTVASPGSSTGFSPQESMSRTTEDLRAAGLDVIIYHGYTMTTKLSLREVLHTIRQYAFLTSDLPLILSIEDNCSVPCQRVLAADLMDILGEFLVTAPVDKEETQLPSPNDLRHRIIVKHKKLPMESEKGGISGSSFSSSIAPSTPTSLTFSVSDSEGDEDILHREDFAKKGVLMMKSQTSSQWHSHLFILFADRLYYTDAGESPGSRDRGHSTSSLRSQEDRAAADVDEDGLDLDRDLPGVKPEEMHITEEWFHGRISRDEAGKLLKSHGSELGDGLYLVRESNTFIGDFSLSFWYRNEVQHCRIKTRMVNGEKKFYLLEVKTMDTLYELISYYTNHALVTPKGRTPLRTPCPQPCPHEDQPWFLGSIGKVKAEELLNGIREDGAFLFRYSSGDNSVFVLSMRVDGAIWHMRLKREGRIFLVNQTIFENLVLLVKYYQEHEIFRGVCLKFPVNEETVAQYHSGETTYTPEGCYLDLATGGGPGSPEIRVRALEDHVSPEPDQLAFSADDVITVLKKPDTGLWYGRLNGRNGWFEAGKVEEMAEGEEEDQRDYRGVLNLAGTTIEQVEDEEYPNCFRVKQSRSYWAGSELLISAPSEEERQDWVNTLLELTTRANDKVTQLRVKEKEARIAAELSALVVYCQAVPFTARAAFYEMCSFSENKLAKLCYLGLAGFNQTHVSRAYPNASRVTSTNFNPVPMWNAGVQMVALNFQTPDRNMQLNQGRFLGNRRSGFVLKPEWMLNPGYVPEECRAVPDPARLTISVIAGRHLCRRDKTRGGIVSPLVEVEVIGLPIDNATFRTRAISSNGLAPVWEEVAEFTINYPEAALLRFYVEDGDFVGPHTDPFVGQLTLPLCSIRTGYRSVPLKNEYSEELELSALLVHIAYRPGTSASATLAESRAERAATVPVARSISSVVTNPPFVRGDSAASSDSVSRDYVNAPGSTPVVTASQRKKGSKLKQLLRFSSKKDSTPG